MDSADTFASPTQNRGQGQGHFKAYSDHHPQFRHAWRDSHPSASGFKPNTPIYLRVYVVASGALDGTFDTSTDAKGTLTEELRVPEDMTLGSQFRFVALQCPNAPIQPIELAEPSPEDSVEYPVEELPEMPCSEAEALIASTVLVVGEPPVSTKPATAPPATTSPATPGTKAVALAKTGTSPAPWLLAGFAILAVGAALRLPRRQLADPTRNT